MGLVYGILYAENYNNYKIIENILTKKMKVNINKNMILKTNNDNISKKFEELSNQMNNKDALIDELNKKMAIKDKEIRDIYNKLIDKDTIIKEMNKALKKNDNLNYEKERRESINQLKIKDEEIENSKN